MQIKQPTNSRNIQLTFFIFLSFDHQEMNTTEALKWLFQHPNRKVPQEKKEKKNQFSNKLTPTNNHKIN